MIVKRFFASAATGPAIRVPLNLYSLEGRYATALYTATLKGGKRLDDIEKDLNALDKYVSGNPSLSALLADPTAPRDLKKSTLLAVLDKTGGKNALLPNLIGVLAENARLSMLGKVVASFGELMRASRREMPITILSATELDPALLKKLGEKLVKYFVPEGQVPVLTSKVDATLMGGMVVHIGDKTIDMSVASKLSKINTLLNEAI